MISILAQQDYESMIEDGLDPSLSDFDRLNTLALRLTDGAETTAANFPRIGFAGDIPFYQPTCQAISWYLTYIKRLDLDVSQENLCWYFALAHGRDVTVFSDLVSREKILKKVDEWIATLPVTLDEITRACRYATVGFDDAVPAKSPQKVEEEKDKSEEDRRTEAIIAVEDRLTKASSMTGIKIDDLKKETPSRLDAMISEVQKLHKDGLVKDTSGLRMAYDLTYRDIKMRLQKQKEEKEKTREI